MLEVRPGSPRLPVIIFCCEALAFCKAIAINAVRFPSLKSSPAGLPVCAGSPKTPNKSSLS